MTADAFRAAVTAAARAAARARIRRRLAFVCCFEAWFAGGRVNVRHENDVEPVLGSELLDPAVGELSYLGASCLAGIDDVRSNEWYIGGVLSQAGLDGGDSLANATE